MRLGILGGTFDPVHIGHLIAAESVREAFGLDRVIFVPACQSPHKSDPPHAPAEIRLKMLETAIRSHIHFSVSDIDIYRPGPSYTVDTLEAVAKGHPGAKLYFVLGSDLIAGLESWHRWEDAVRLATFVEVHRPSVDPEIPEKLRGAVKRLEISGVDISSTLIRARVAAGKSIRYLVPAAVQDLIEAEGLYGRKNA